MTTESQLPTVDELLNRAAEQVELARRHLSEASGLLHSNWNGEEVTDQQTARGVAMYDAVEVALGALSNGSKGARGA